MLNYPITGTFKLFVITLYLIGHTNSLNLYIFSLACSMVVWNKHLSEVTILFHDIHALKHQNEASISITFIFYFVCCLIVILLVMIALCINYCDKQYVPFIRTLTVICPVVCIIAHSPYIVIAYLNDGDHASSIFIYYCILIYVFFWFNLVVCTFVLNYSTSEGRKRIT